MTPAFLYGAGGHGRAVAEVLRREGRYRLACVIDDGEWRPTVGDAPWIGGFGALAQLGAEGISGGVVAIGDGGDRERLSELARDAGLELLTLVDPSAVVASTASLGAGTVLMPHSFAGAGVRIGDGVILNTGASADHDCVIGDYVHLGVGVRLAGECRIGDGSLLGIGAVVGPHVTIGAQVVVGAGAVVLDDVADGLLVAGVPARVISGAL